MQLIAKPVARIVLRGATIENNVATRLPFIGRVAAGVVFVAFAGVAGFSVMQTDCLAQAAATSASKGSSGTSLASRAGLAPGTGLTPGTTLPPGTQTAASTQPVPPRVRQARRFLAERGISVGGVIRAGTVSRGSLGGHGPKLNAVRPMAVSGATSAPATSGPTWTAVGPLAVETPSYGLISGEVSALALDPADSSGNTLYVGTMGGGVWKATNAAGSALGAISFTPLTDGLEGLSSIQDASLSIGALTVQPQGTGVILAGTGDPNDESDSYYGGGILRSADGGKTWSLIQRTADPQNNCGGTQEYSFAGEGLAGFAWSTTNPQLVVAAVSQAYEGTLVNALLPGASYEGMYYSLDAGVCWYLATITDGNGVDVQGPNDLFTAPDGNGATSVVWNPVRQMFIAAVRFHGYYQSPDGVTWTRMTAQPGGGLAALRCPTNPLSTGSIACPILRGTLAVNQYTGDTFAWTVDIDNQDQGLWQDQCSISAGVCTNTAPTFARQWSTKALETSTTLGAATIEYGNYTLALTAAPNAPGQGQDTILLAGAQDLWRCSLAMGCEWRNTTNASTCMSAQVASFQHALTWNISNPLEMFVGNDSGLWRSMDGIQESGAVCSASDASHFENLNGTLGSLAEVVSLAQDPVETYTMMAGLGANGTAGVKTATGPVGVWPQILGGDGGEVAIDPHDSTKWYVNSEPGVSIYECSQVAGCTAADFGTSAVVTDADVGGDGYSMEIPAPFLVDPADTTQLLVGTCRVWRGPANGSGWNSSNAISPILDNRTSTSSCNGDALIRSIAVLPVQGEEVIYVGMYGAADWGGNLAGHVLRAALPPNGAEPVWLDLTLNPVENDANGMNAYGFDISSIFIDSHDATGNTVYVTVAVESGPNEVEPRSTVYRSVDGGATWTRFDSNLPHSPANAVVVDPQDANTVYVALDAGVWFTTQAGTGSCTSSFTGCWSEFGIGLPPAPVVGLIASSAAAQSRTLTAATYGRGVWQTPLWTAETGLTTALAAPGNLTFTGQSVGTVSTAQTVTLTNTGNLGLTITQVTPSGDFGETDNCANATIAAGASCSLQVTFAPATTGSQTGEIVVSANVYGGQFAISLMGTGTAAGDLTLNPLSVDFGQVDIGSSSATTVVGASNGGSQPVTFTSIGVTGPFSVSTNFTNACGTAALAAGNACSVNVTFTPTQSGAAAGTLTFADSAGTQTVLLSGSGAATPTDSLIPNSLTFQDTAEGQLSPAQTVTVTNTGDLALNSILFSVSGEFVIASSSTGSSTGTCTGTLAAHAACGVSVQFAPTQLGSLAGVLTISDALRTQSVPLSGTGVEPPAFGVNPASLTFPSQQPGVASAPQSVTVTNTGGAALTGLSPQILGAATGVFSISATSCGATLAPGASCILQVVFNPATTGGSAGTLNISSSSAGVAAVNVGLSGTAQTAAGLNVSPAMLSFGAVAAGGTSAARTVTISNSSSFAASALTFGVSQGFSWTQQTCVGSLTPGASCTVGVSFSPTVSGAATGTLTVSSASIATAATVTLTGTGAVGASIQVSPGSINFSATGAGQTSSPTTLTVTNEGTVDSVNGLTLTAPAGFTLVTNTCAATLAAGTSCTVGVEFAPQSAGAAAGSLTVAATGLPSQTIALQGMGFDFTMAVSGASSQTVSSGLSASYTLVLTTLSGSQGTFTLGCNTLPSNATCVFTPTGPTVGSGATGNVTLQISTGTLAASNRGERGGSPMAPLVCGLALLSLGWRRRRRVLLLCGLALVIATGVTSCTSAGPAPGGGGGGGGGSTSTPAGTYQVPVSATADGVQHSVTLTLVVD